MLSDTFSRQGLTPNKLKFIVILHIGQPVKIVVGEHLPTASYSEQVELRAMLDELFDQTPELARHCADFSADRGLDCAETKA
jgi:hypothetical protein